MESSNRLNGIRRDLHNGSASDGFSSGVHVRPLFGEASFVKLRTSRSRPLRDLGSQFTSRRERNGDCH